jgi:hypothetical protein
VTSGRSPGDALDAVAEAFTRTTQAHGSEAVWPYHSGGTMGVVQRYGLDRPRHAMRYARQQTTICVTPARSGWLAGVGVMNGVDPREMAEAEIIVVWGGNPVFSMTAREWVDLTPRTSGRGTREAAAEHGWIDCALPFAEAHFEDGFGFPDGRFRFKPNWAAIGPARAVMPPMPDQMTSIEVATAGHPFRLVVPPARSFPNTSFTETPTSRARQGEPWALVHPDGLLALKAEKGNFNAFAVLPWWKKVLEPPDQEG